MKCKTKAEKKAKRDRDFASYAKRGAAKLRPLYPNDNNVTAGGDALSGALDIPPFLQISRERRKAAWREFDARGKAK